MSCYSKLLSNCQEYLDVKRYIENGVAPSGIIGLPPSPKAHLIHSLCADLSRKALVVLPSEGAAVKLVTDINEFCGNKEKAFLFPARDYSFNSAERRSREFEQIRLKTLLHILSGEYDVIACSAEAAMQLTVPPKELKKRSLKIDADTEISPEKLVELLLSAGFTRADTVEGPGQFARRGGIVDFYPISAANPVRIELWGDNIDAVSAFDVSSQRRTDILDGCEISPRLRFFLTAKNSAKKNLKISSKTLRAKVREKQKKVWKKTLPC